MLARYQYTGCRRIICLTGQIDQGISVWPVRISCPDPGKSVQPLFWHVIT